MVTFYALASTLNEISTSVFCYKADNLTELKVRFERRAEVVTFMVCSHKSDYRNSRNSILWQMAFMPEIRMICHRKLQARKVR